MDPNRNDKFKHTEPEFHNTRDAFGNQLQVGDEVYYATCQSGGRYYKIARGKVTHFTKWKIGVDGIAREFDKLGKIFAASEKETTVPIDNPSEI